MLVGGIADKRNFGKNRGHVGADQHNEGSFLYTAVANGRALDRETAVQRLLHVPGKLARFLDFFLERDLLYQILQFVNGLLRNRIFARGYFQRLR